MKNKTSTIKYKIKPEHFYSISLILLAGISIIPLIIMCKYNHPSADDFDYAISTAYEWNSSHSLWNLLLTAIETSKQFYNSWQGLYFSAFLLALQPAIFGEEYYFLSGIIMLFLIIFSTCFFFSYIIKKIIGGTILDGVTIGSAASFLMIQWMPSCVEGIYWFNGAINYGFFYAILLFLICAAINLHTSTSKKSSVKTIIISIILTFVLEGGNHITAFMGILIIFSFLITEFILKRRNKIIYFFSILLFMLICFFANISSPGTQIRHQLINYKSSVISTILEAISGSIEKINIWLNLAPIIVALLLMPLFIKLAKQISQTFNFKFSNPFFVFVGSIAWICLMYCPPLYAMGMLGEGRIHDIVYYNFILLFLINVFYYTGWVIRHLDDFKANNYNIDTKWLCCTIVLLIGLWISNWNNSWSHKAFAELKAGLPQQYSAQANARYEQLCNSTNLDVRVAAFNVTSELLFYSDITEDPNHWKNLSIKKFYNLNSIAIE